MLCTFGEAMSNNWRLLEGVEVANSPGKILIFRWARATWHMAHGVWRMYTRLCAHVCIDSGIPHACRYACACMHMEGERVWGGGEVCVWGGG